jgi:hypothetical protein
MSNTEIERPEIVEYLYQKFLILFTNSEVISLHNFSKLSDNILLITHFFSISFTNHNSFGTIWLNRSLPYVVSIIFPSYLTLTTALKSTAQAS